MDKKHDAKKRWYDSHHDEVLAKRRLSLLGSGDKHFSGLTKREYPGHCELCGVEVKRLVYQHWDDDNPSLGIWCCTPCQRIAQGVEAANKQERIVAAYVALKDKLIAGGE